MNVNINSAIMGKSPFSFESMLLPKKKKKPRKTKNKPKHPTRRNKDVTKLDTLLEY